MRGRARARFPARLAGRARRCPRWQRPRHAQPPGPHFRADRDPDMTDMNERQHLPSVHTHTSIRVMLVDDHKTMLWGLERLIGGEHSGMQVVATACDSASTLAQAASTCPDVIVLDLDLGGVSSLAIIPQLLQNGNARILVLTGSHDQAVMEQAMLHGARGIISKDAP